MKLLATDFDKTLYVKDENITLKNIEAIKQFKLNNNLFVIVTGRQYSDIVPLIKKYKILFDYLICEDGMIIYDQDYLVVKKHFLPEQKVEKIRTILDNYQYRYLMDNGIYYNKDIKNCVKIAAFYKQKKDTDLLIKELQELGVYIYTSENWINIIDNKMNKYKALEYIRELLNMRKEEIYTIGDSINDKEMLDKFQGTLMKEHHASLNFLKLKEYETLYQYIEELVND